MHWLSKNKYRLGILIALAVGFTLLLPNPLFQVPYSTVVLDREGGLLGAHTAEDGQWRFPLSDSVPDKFAHCLLQFEDEYFYYHPGINPFSTVRALWGNIQSGKVKRGGSTLTMQVIRLSRGNPKRTYLEKAWEMLLAIRLEFAYSKEEIIQLWSAHAPFGGNVVGLEAASWRYYGKPANKLTWAESATLAVLPNAPSIIYPGKNREPLIRKRNRLLAKLLDNGQLDSAEYSLALIERAPEKPHPLPRKAPHLVDRLEQSNTGQLIQTTLHSEYQNRSREIVNRFALENAHNHIHNAAALIVDVKSAEVLAYIGNAEDGKYRYENWVDIMTARRSTGSLLKPFLYGAMLDDGKMTPYSLQDDIPVHFRGYSPKNFNRQFEGVVRADQALTRSLNVPAVNMLQEYGMERFHQVLKKSGMNTLDFSSGHYGLSLVLGGSEGTLENLSQLYLNLARAAAQEPGKQIHFMAEGAKAGFNFPLRSEMAWFTARALSINSRVRPSSQSKWAWKTGTSFGNRDAWAIGFNGSYLVAVWVGNADGEGRPGLTGATKGIPLMRELAQQLPSGEWFPTPRDRIEERELCSFSGAPKGPNCYQTQVLPVPRLMKDVLPCSFCHRYMTDSLENFRYKKQCLGTDMAWKWSYYFELSPVKEWYYSQLHADHRKVPPLAALCLSEHPSNPMGLIFPDKNNLEVYIPIELDGRKGKVVFQAVHRQPGHTIYWHLNEQFLGETRDIHQISIQPEPGEYTLVLLDQSGNEIRRQLKILERD